MICVAVAGSCSLLAACGGAIQHDEGVGDGAADPRNPLSTPAPEAGTPYGAWDLVSLQGMPGGKQSTLTSEHLSLELRNDGTAVARLCTRPYFEVGQSSYRCADARAYDCLYGSVVTDGVGWEVNIPGLASTSRSSSGVILDEQTDTLVVRHILPKYAAGTFARIMEDPPTRSCGGP